MRASQLYAPAILALAAAGVTLASEPGDPLGPEDWVFNTPGVYAELPFEAELATALGNSLRFHTLTNTFVLLEDESVVSTQEVDVTGRILVLDVANTGMFCGTKELLDTKLIAMDGNGNSSTIGFVRDRCVDPTIPRVDRLDPGTFRRSILGLYEPVTGSVYARLWTSQYTADLADPDYQEMAVIIRIHGLPSVVEAIPEGPPGPPGLQGPPGPQGPAGMDADESRILALESLVAAQQTEIDALRTTLEQVENLPTIRHLLEKVQELEQQP